VGFEAAEHIRTLEQWELDDTLEQQELDDTLEWQ
jgi:hypothetical protein